MAGEADGFGRPPLSFGMKLVVALLVVAGALLRIHGAGWALTQDEALTWWTARAGIAELLTWTHHPEHPPLSFALVRLAVGALGTDAEWALRFPSLLAGVLAVPAAFALGRRFSTPASGVCLAALVAFDPFLIEQARTARMYSGLVLLTLVALLLLDRLAGRGEGRVSSWSALGIVLAAGLWTHWLGLAVWAGVLVALFAGSGSRPAGRGTATAFGIAGLLGGTGLWRFASLLLSDAPGPPGPDLAGMIPLLLRRIPEIAGGGAPGWIAVAVGLVGILTLLRRPRTRPVALALAVIGVISILSAIFAAGGRPWGVDRYLVLLRLTVFVGVAGLAASADRRMALAGMAAASLAILAALPSIARSPGAAHATGALARSMADDLRPEDAVTYLPTYLHRIGGYYGLPFRPVAVGRDGRLRHPWPHTRTWILLAHPRALPTMVPGRPGRRDPLDDDRLKAVFRVYGLEVDRAKLKERLEQEGAVAIGLDRTGVRISPNPR